MTESDEKEKDSLPPSPEAQTESIALSDEDAKALTDIFILLEEYSAVDFSQYRRTTVLRRISRRMGLMHLTSFEEYKNILQDNSDELGQLHADLLLSFTQFFRDPHIFTALREKVFPHLVENRSAKSPIRIWVPGCSTGEEVYSLAIAIYEYLEETGASANLQFFGTDLVENNIIRARSGLYGSRILEQVDEKRLQRFFDADNDGFRVTKTIREMCVFATQDITRDPPFPNIDLISCRNVLIYFNEKYQDIVFPLFHFALKPGGYLMLGSSETISRLPQLFVPFDQRANIYRKRGMASSVMYRLPFYQASDRARVVSLPDGHRSHHKEASMDVGRLVNDLLVSEFSPPGVLVDNNLLIRQFIGRPHPFIAPGSGEASLKLSKMAHESLLPDLYVAIEECKKSQARITRSNLRFSATNERISVDITVLPFRETNLPQSYLILFAARPIDPGTQGVEDDSETNQETEVLKQELKITRSHLQAIIEEKDEVNLELWAANEEVQSTNEELQSVNEEMEAAKEELESSNEELMALNEELQAKNREITEREQQLRELFDNMTDGFASHRMLYDDQGRPVDYEFVEVNRVFASRMGMTPETMVGKTIRSIAADTEQYWIDMFDRVAQTGTPHMYTTYSKESDRHYEARLYRPKPGYCAAIFSDVTEQVKTELALRHSEEKLKSYIESSPLGIFVADDQGRYIEVNTAACQITGYTKEELSGMHLTQIIHPDDIALAGEHFSATRMEGEATGELRFLTKSGEVRHWQVDAVKLSETRYLGIASDCTESHVIRQQMQQSEKMRAVGQLAGGIAHDFNNQLSGILGFADLLLDEVKECQSATQYVHNIMAAVKHSADLTSQLLAFSRKGKYLDVAVDMHAVISEVSILLSHSIDKRIELQLELNAQNTVVNGDPTQLQNAILNLALNARDAMRNGGNLSFKTQNTMLNQEFCENQNFPLLPGAYIQIMVCDTGCGMSEDVLPHIFEPFFTTKALGEGVGMGLAATYGTARNHKGIIFVESSEGHGSTFTLYLPVKENGETRTAGPSTSKVPETSAHILFVDDEDTICMLAETIFETLAYKVTIQNDGESALHFYQKNWRDIDLVILDMVMPKMGGKDAFIAMKKCNPDIRAIVSSGYSVKGQADELMQLGVAEFIQKPFRKAELAEKVRQVLATRIAR